MDTKVVRNSRETPAKMSMIEKVINKTLWIILVIQLVFAIICDALYNVFANSGGNDAWCVRACVRACVQGASPLVTLCRWSALRVCVLRQTRIGVLAAAAAVAAP